MFANFVSLEALFPQINLALGHHQVLKQGSGSILLSSMLFLPSILNTFSEVYVQCSCSGWPTGHGKKKSSSQAQLGQATCFVVAYFLSISYGPSTPSAL